MAKTKIDWAELKAGNRLVTTGGYVIVYCPSHPHAKPNGYVFEHRLIMENQLKRFLHSWEHVHHINHKRSDNRPENLEVLLNRKHAKEHMISRPKELKDRSIKILNDAAAKRRIPRIEVLCACGCGVTLITPHRKGRPRRFIQGHNRTGQHWRWNCG